MKNGDTPAMPSKAEVSNADESFAYQFDHGSKFQFPGLTKREMFAMHLMSSLISDGAVSEIGHEHFYAVRACAMADALLEELEE